MGRKIQPVVVDPASNCDLFAEKAKQLLLQDKVAVTFGCWTSVSRKSVLPVFESHTACCSTRCKRDRCGRLVRSSTWASPLMLPCARPL
jgi:hypothetical protein